jgi:hypothetical protein
MHITEIPERTTIQFANTVANLLTFPVTQTLQMVFEIDASDGRPGYIDVGNGIILERESAPSDIKKDRWKEREANEIVRRIRRRLLGLLARWKLWKSPLTFEKPAIHSEKGVTVKVFNVVVHKQETFVDSYLRLLNAIRQHRHYQGMSIADPFVSQSLTKARKIAATRAATTDFVLNVAAESVVADTPAELPSASSSEPEANAAPECPPTADMAIRASREISTIKERRLAQGRGFSLDWD